MYSVTLTPADRKPLRSFVLHAPTGRECCRAQALLGLDGGDPMGAVAAHLQVSRQTIYHGVERFQQREDLDVETRWRDGERSGRPPSALGIIDPIIDEIIDQDPRHFGYHATAWTASLFEHHRHAAYGGQVSPKSVSRALTRLRIRWKRPRHVLGSRPDTWRHAQGGCKPGLRSAAAPSG